MNKYLALKTTLLFAELKIKIMFIATKKILNLKIMQF